MSACTRPELEQPFRSRNRAAYRAHQILNLAGIVLVAIKEIVVITVFLKNVVLHVPSSAYQSQFLSRQLANEPRFVLVTSIRSLLDLIHL